MFGNLSNETEIKEESNYEQIDLFTNYEEIENKKREETKKMEKEKQIQKTIIEIKYKFAALTGFEELVKETARKTEDRVEIDEELKYILDEKISIIQNQIKNNPKVTITYFIPDNKKKGGKYQTITECVKKIDKYNKIIILTDGTNIPIKEITDITGKIFMNFVDFFDVKYL